MSKDSLAWLLVRVFGLICLMAAARALFIAIPALATDVPEAHHVVAVQLTKALFGSLFAYYLLRRGKAVHSMLVYEQK